MGQPKPRFPPITLKLPLTSRDFRTIVVGMAQISSTSTDLIGTNGHPLTNEQQRILAMPPTKTRKWQAFAGCAKTTTSIEYAHAWPQYDALYLAFNSAIASEAKGKFPRHIQTQTAHGHAYQTLGVRRFQDRLVQRLRPNDLDGCVDLLRPIPQMTEIAIRRAVLKSLHNFLISGNDEVEAQHLNGFPFQARQHCLPMVTAVIERLMDYENSKLPFAHDIYLKAFARLGKISDQFSYLIIDEAQDLNPVLIDIVNKARRPAMIVGDPYQSIYAFRGAENAMDCFDGETATLSQSFRFGPKIAEVANQILRQSLDTPNHPLIGFEPIHSSVSEYQGKIKQRSTLLARTNFRLFEGLVQIKLPFHMIGGIDEMINQVSAGYALFKGIRTPVPDQIVARFQTWDDCKDASEHEDDPDLIRLVRIVEQYTDAIPEILAGMRTRHCPDVSKALIIVGTGHKAKGLEYDNVVVLDDFLTPSQLRGMLSRKKITPREYNQEINLLYVVLTRAKLNLSISQPLFDEVAGGAGLSDRLFDPM